MNVQEMWKALHLYCSGEKGKKHSTISEYEKIKYPAIGYKKAEKYLEGAKRGQDNCQSDWSYWHWESDIAIAETLMNVFKALKEGKKEFPDLKDDSAFLMDRQASLTAWSSKL
jgi:hypothetical protein